MHNLDRSNSFYEMENDNEFQNEFQNEMDGEFEYDNEYDFEMEYDNEFEMEENGSLFSEEEEMELASELLNVGSEEELDQFLGKLFRRVKKGVGRVRRGVKRFSRSRVGRFLMPKLKGIARKALRVGGRGIGGFFGGPAGAAIGGRLGNYASRMFEMELEGLSPEDQEFEIAKRFVRFAGSAIDNAENQGANGQPNQVANESIEEAARVHAPGLLKSSSSRRPTRSSGAGNGKWIKRGNKIILFGVS